MSGPFNMLEMTCVVTKVENTRHDPWKVTQAVLPDVSNLMSRGAMCDSKTRRGAIRSSWQNVSLTLPVAAPIANCMPTSRPLF